MGYDVYWSGDDADLRHLTREAWQTLTEDLLARFQDGEIAGTDEDHCLMTWKPYGEQVIVFNEREDRGIDTDDVTTALTMIAPYLLPGVAEDKTFKGEVPAMRVHWSGEEDDDKGEIRAYPDRVEYAPMEATYPTAATYPAGDSSQLDGARAKAEADSAARQAEYVRERIAKHDAQHAAIKSPDDLWKHVKSEHYREPGIPSRVSEQHDDLHAEEVRV